MGGVKFFGGAKSALSRIEGRNKQLLQLEKEHSAVQEIVRHYANGLGRKQRLLGEKAGLISKLERELSERQQLLEKRSGQLNAEAVKFSKREAELNDAAERIRAEEAGLKLQEKKLAYLRNELAQLKRLREEAVEKEAGLKDRLGRLQGEVAAKEQKLAELGRGCNNAEASLKKSSGELQLIMGRKAEEEKSLHQRRKGLDKLEKELSARENNVARERAEIEKDRLALKKLREELDDESKLVEEARKLEQQLEAKESGMDAIQLGIQKRSDELARKEELLGKKIEEVLSREKAFEKENVEFGKVKAEAESLLRRCSEIDLREKNASKKEAALKGRECQLALGGKELARKEREIALALPRFKSEEGKLKELRREVSQEQYEFRRVKKAVAARSSVIEQEYASLEAKQKGLDERQLKLVEREKGIQKVKDEARSSIRAANNERLRLAAMVRAVEKEKKELLGQGEALEAFHRELLNKEAVAARRLEAVHHSLKDLGLKEKQAQARLAEAVGRLNDVNKKLLSAERRLEKTALVHREYEEKIGGHMARLKNLTAELSHLQRIKKELEHEFAEVGSIEKAASYIGALLKLGELEKAIRAYESLRLTYSCMGRGVKKKLYPKLIDLHYTISEYAKRESGLTPKL